MPERTVSEVLRDKPCVTVEADTTARRVAHLMKDNHSSAVLVVAKGMLIGICTERDLVSKVVAADRNPAHTRVDAVMTPHPQTIGPDKPFCHALHLMYEGGFRHVPVVDAGGRPLGLLVARDALSLDALQFDEELVRREEITVIL
jgi:CBS domain-containing protein